MAFLFPALLPIVASLTIMIIAITYIGGKVFRIPQWEAYFNVELHNLVLAMFVISFAFGTLESTKMISRSIVGDDPIVASKAFLNALINKGLLPMYKDLLSIEAGTSLSNSFMLRVGPSVWSSVHKVEPGADAVLSMARLMSFGLLAIYGSISVQYIGLSIIDFTMPIVLSLGMLLFVFPPTREAGAFLMCFAFAFGVVFPFTYALNQTILNDMSNIRYGHPYQDYMPEMFGQHVRGIGTISAYLAPFASLANFELLIPFINAMAHLSLVALFLPALSISLTVSTINALTKFLMGKL